MPMIRTRYMLLKRALEEGSDRTKMRVLTALLHEAEDASEVGEPVPEPVVEILRCAAEKEGVSLPIYLTKWGHYARNADLRQRKLSTLATVDGFFAVQEKILARRSIRRPGAEGDSL